MLLRPMLSDIRCLRNILVRGLSTKPAWDIVTGVCVERLPVVTPPLNDLQNKYRNLLESIEIEQSLKSDHELRHEHDKVQAELLKNESIDVDMDTVSKITAQDFEDACNEEFAQHKLASIETEADKTGDKSTPDRCLQRHLVLVKQVKLGKDVRTVLPQAPWKEGETLRQTAERVLAEQCGSLSAQLLSNAPCGYYKYKYPAEMDGKVGAKVFFYYANYKDGDVSTKDKSVSWLNRSELGQALPERYMKSVKEFLIEETY